jgi:TPR repeat protein
MHFLKQCFGAGLTPKDLAPAPYVAPLKRHDYATAVPLLQAAMQRDDACAMGLMAALKGLGCGVEKDLNEACRWFRQAAVRGHVPSQTALGMCLAGGLGTPPDNQEAAYWQYQAGIAGNRQAIEVLGELAFRDHSVVGPHFTEDALCRLVMRLRKVPNPLTTPLQRTRLH